MAIGGQTDAGHGARTTAWQYLDVLLVAISIAPALALGAPALGYGLGAGGWALQRLVHLIDTHWIRRFAKPITQLAATLFEAFGRIWLLAGVIVIAAVVGGRVDGLTAALVILAAYTVAFGIKVVSGPPLRSSPQ